VKNAFQLPDNVGQFFFLVGADGL